MCLFPLHFITHFIPQIQAKKSKSDNTAFFLISFYCHLLVKQKAGYEKSDQKAAFCLGLSRSLVWDSKTHLILNEEQPCMSAEVEDGHKQFSLRCHPPHADLLSLPGFYCSFLPKMTGREEAALHLQVEGRTVRDTGGTNKKMTLNHLLRTFNREQHLLEEEHWRKVNSRRRKGFGFEV